jgi:transcriptional regulator with XRE-family HTH domain
MEQPFSRWLRAELRLHRLSLRQIAERSGVSHSTLSRLLRGRQPSLATAARIARALGQPDAAVAAIAGLEAPSHRETEVLARVERALRADSTLDERRIRRVMAFYLACRTEVVPSRPLRNGMRIAVPSVHAVPREPIVEQVREPVAV